MQKRDLFISHSSADKETAAALAADFEKRGISCWYAPRDIPFGSTYQAEIVNAIEHCRAMLLLFSDAANNSEHILREVELAAQGKKPIYPLRIDAAHPTGGLKYMLANRHWVERKAIGDRLAEAIGQLVAAQQAADPADGPRGTIAPPPPVPKGNPRWAIAAGLAFLLCAGAGVAWFLYGKSPEVPKATPQVAQRDVPSAALTPQPQTTLPAPPANRETPPPVAAVPATPEPPAGAAPAPATPPAAAPATPPPAAPEQPLPAPPPRIAQEQPPPPSVSPPVVREPAPEPTPAPVGRTPPEGGAPGGKAAQALQPPILAHAPTNASALGAGIHLFRECEACPVMAVVPAGKYRIGSPPGEPGRSPDEGPQQEVVIRQPFAAGRSEVSFEEWGACVADGGCNAHAPSDYGFGRGKKPVIFVSWNDAKAYVAWLSRKTGASYRLLSEAEWEYAARGCNAPACPTTAFWFGADIDPEKANYDWNISYHGSPKALPLRRTVEVDKSESNPFGLLHVHGNVREWVEDCWNPSLAGLPQDASPRLTGDCTTHVVRGGSWRDAPKDLRSAKRHWEEAGTREQYTGFRVARSFAQQAQIRGAKE